jgi:hypothetical protein
MTASIKITELSELLSVDNSNTILFATDLSVSPNVSHFVKVGTLGNLTDYTIANAAFLRANVAFSTGYSANTALFISGLSYQQSNSAFAQSNIAFNHASAGFNRANSANVTAQSSFNRANDAFIHANSSYNLANSIGISSQSSFNRANDAFIHANSSYNLANSTTVLTQSAFNQINTALLIANTSLLRTGGTITGIVNSPTAANGTSNTMIATTQFVDNSIKNSIAANVPVLKAYAVFTIAGNVATLVRGYNVFSVSRLATGRYMVTYSNNLTQADYSVNASVSTFNDLAGANAGTRNFDHIINVESTTINSVIVNTSDAKDGGNNSPHDVYKVWISVFE